jgi:uncharacterized membrane protein
MSQADENQEKTPKTDAVLMRPHEDPHRRIDEVPPRNPDDEGQVRVERDGRLEPVDAREDR